MPVLSPSKSETSINLHHVWRHDIWNENPHHCHSPPSSTVVASCIYRGSLIPITPKILSPWRQPVAWLTKPVGSLIECKPHLFLLLLIFYLWNLERQDRHLFCAVFFLVPISFLPRTALPGCEFVSYSNNVSDLREVRHVLTSRVS